MFNTVNIWYQMWKYSKYCTWYYMLKIEMCYRIKSCCSWVWCCALCNMYTIHYMYSTCSRSSRFTSYFHRLKSEIRSSCIWHFLKSFLLSIFIIFLAVFHEFKFLMLKKTEAWETLLSWNIRWLISIWEQYKKS